MASVRFTIGGAVMNVLTFSGTDFFYSNLWIMVKKNTKHTSWRKKKPQRVRGEWNRDIIKRLDFIDKRLSEKN